MLQISLATLSDLPQLQQISRTTFVETFGAVNTPENMEMYLTESLGTEKLTKELSNINSEFYFAILNDEVIGYLKLNYV